MDIERLYEFEVEFKSAERIFIHPNEVASYYKKWHSLYQEILDVARKE
jgi:8-oxo-dGTP diphosphatase